MKVSELNIEDYSDVEIAKGMFDSISSAEWEEYVSYAFDNKLFSYDDKGFLGQMKYKARKAKSLSAKQVFKALRLIEKLNDAIEVKEKSDEAKSTLESELFNPQIKNVTFRVAWHDSGWNGHICKDPKANKYCSGFHSLLSDRIRKRKYKSIQNELTYSGKHLNDIDYLPPCFWSINLFGSKKLNISHDNPAAPQLDKIQEELPANSVFSWPFAVSFTRSKQETERDGAYPANLESVRVPFFNAKIKNQRSIGFIYANYSNPFTEEEGKYLLIGAGFILDKGDLTEFKPEEEIEKIRNKKKKLRNFPKTNWAIRFSFETPDSMVRMPYHEYLEYCEKNNLPEEEREKVLASVKVSITEPELEHCFKYVAMDIDDDEAIFLLSKMYQKLIEIQNIGIVDPTDIADRIQTVKSLLSHCWIVRGHFPGFENICRAVLNFNEPKFPLSDLITRLKETENDYVQKLEDLFDNPYSDNRYKIFSKYVEAITDKLQGAYGITNRQFIQLAMLNLTQFQFERILSGYISYPDKSTHTVKSICDNPYILFEEYEQVTSNISESTGDIFDNPIELFKIDIAYYPDINYTDKISIQSSFKYNDKRRVRALIIRHLLTLENSGDCFEEASSIEKALREYPLFYKSGDEYLLPTDFLLSATGDYLIHLEEKLKVVPANDTRYFYLIWLYECEKDIEKAFQTLLDEPDNTKSYTDLNEHLKRSIKKLSATLGSKFDEDTFKQERTRLYTNIFKKRLFVLAGNPGSGKSYELLNIIRDIEAQNETYILLAPTGKAALRLINDNDFKGIDASTIDKLIADVNSGKRTKQSVLNTNNIIIDEMSMVDLMKFHSLLDYINYKLPSFKRLILVGDPNQLPPIGYGKILRDIIYYCKTKSDYTDNYIELTTNCRLELANSKLLDLSGAFTYKGDIDESLKQLITSGNEDISEGLRIKYWDNEQNLYKSLADEFDYLCNENELTGTVSERLNLLFGLDKDGDFEITEGFNLEYFQIITPYKAAYFGSTFINDFIQEQFKPTDEYEILDGWFKQSDKVIRTKNYYVGNELIISNGSIGLARSEGRDLLYLAENDYEPIPFKEIRKGEREFFDLAYSITVHKSQGSGFDHTFVILPQKLGLLSKELVYTALTRSRKSVTLFIEGNINTPFEKSILEKARRRSYTEFRKTTLMLLQPFRYYSLEPEPGVFVESRIELMIYYALMKTREKLGKVAFDFMYEVMPISEGTTIPIKTDFTLFSNGKTFYWEHLGRLSEKEYARKWKEVKFPTYQKYNLTDRLITTDELNGIDPSKIDEVIVAIASDNLSSTDTLNRYSKHHYSLR